MRNVGSAPPMVHTTTNPHVSARRRTIQTAPTTARIEQQRGGQRQRRRGRVPEQRIRRPVLRHRTEANAGNEAFEADRVRSQVLHDGGRQEPRREEAVVVPGEPVGPRRILQRQQLAAAGHREQRAELGEVHRGMGGERHQPSDDRHDRHAHAGATADRPDGATPARSRTPRWRTPLRARSERGSGPNRGRPRSRRPTCGST